MNERFSVRLGNPVAIFFSSSAMLLTGIVIGVLASVARMGHGVRFCCRSLHGGA